MMQLMAKSETDLEVLSRVISDIEHAYNRKESKHYIEKRDFLPIMRAVRVLARDNKRLSEEVISLSSLVLGEHHDP